MSDYPRKFRACIDNAGLILRVGPSVYLKRGRVQDFLLEPCEDYYTLQQYIAKAVEYLCRNEDCPVMDDVVCLAALEFLDNEVGRPATDAKLLRMRDLRAIVKADGPLTSTEIENWAAGWYP